MRAIAVGHGSQTEHGLLKGVFSDFGITLEIEDRDKPSNWSFSESIDYLILYGSDLSLVDLETRRSTCCERDLVARSVARGTPVLGICFGAQLLSCVFGGEVMRMDHPEIGWSNVLGVGSDLSVAGRWMQWHYDCFTVPPSFTAIGVNSFGTQAMRGHRCLGVQFHPEANVEVVSRWIEIGGREELQAFGISESRLLMTTKEFSAQATDATRRLIQYFLEDIAS